VIVHAQVWNSDGVLTVPVGALFRKGGDWAVYAVEDGRAHTRPVAIGRRNAQMAEVVSGLAAGAGVVLHPSDKVRDGVRVAQRETR
jgi:HlyD family secretion protein